MDSNFALKINQFYSAKSLRKKHFILDSKEKELQKEVSLKPYKPRFKSKSLLNIWKVFKCQQDAVDYSFISKDLAIFSFESYGFDPKSGCRYFLVTTYDNFWHNYSQSMSIKRNFYEVIFHHSPCHLYFDIEYEYKYNLDKDGSYIISIFLKLICYWINEMFNILCTEKDFLILSSSSDSKFSRHIILHLPDNVCFANNYEIGLFVRYIRQKYLIAMGINNLNTESITNKLSQENSQQNINLKKKIHILSEKSDLFQSTLNKENNSILIESDDSSSEILENNSNNVIEDAFNLTSEELEKLLIQLKNGKLDLFCDMGVYTKNRNFRLYLSSKRGKNNPFVIAKENKFEFDDFKSPKKNKLLEENMKDNNLIDEEKIFKHSLICNINPNCGLLEVSYKIGSTFSQPCTMSYAMKSSSLDNFKQNKVVLQSSGNPKLDNFVRSKINIGGIQGKIYRCCFYEDSINCCSKLYFDIVNNRWCENVGRQHKSNNIRIAVDLNKRVYYQTCHDPDCREINFKTQELPIPDHVFD